MVRLGFEGALPGPSNNMPDVHQLTRSTLSRTVPTGAGDE